MVYYLRNDEVAEADELMKDMEPSTPQEYILKGVVNAMMGQKAGSREHLKVAQQFFQLVGSSASECDTIPGRQCMASCFFLLRQFEDVNIYLKSIKVVAWPNSAVLRLGYPSSRFVFTCRLTCTTMTTSTGTMGFHSLVLAISRCCLPVSGSLHCAAVVSRTAMPVQEAEDTLLLVQNERYRSEYTYVSWLARCYIMNDKPKNAWDLYLKMDTSNESFNLLQLIANDAYKMGHFYYAAKAFDVLERLDPDPEYWEGKRGACVGVFQKVIARQESMEALRDVVSMLRNTMNPQVSVCCTAGIKSWGRLS